MDAIVTAITQMGVLVLIVALGFFLARVDYIDGTMAQRLTKLIVNVTLPCMIIASVGDLDLEQVAAEIPETFGLSALLFVLLLAWSLVGVLVLRVPRDKWAVYLFMGVCTNTGFMGTPIIASIYGSQTVILSSIFVTVLALFVYSIGFSLLSADQQQRKPGAQSEKFKIPWKSVLNPAMIAAVAALVVLFARIPLPPMLLDATNMVGGMTAPISMMVVGYFLSSIALRDLIAEWRLIPATMLRQLVGPLVAYFILRLFITDELLLGVFVLMFAMPVGSMVPTFVSQFDGDTRLASKGTIVSTALSFVFVPVLLAAMAL